MRIAILGAGKVGRALAAAIRHAGGQVTLRAARKGPPRRPFDADLVILAVRDRQLPGLIEALLAGKAVTREAAYVHVAGALRSDALAPLRGACAGVAQMHPMIAFASTRFFPQLAKGNVHVEGDRVAVARARRLARALGMTPRTFARLDTVGYHAAASLVANTGAAVAALGAEVLVASGVPRAEAPKLLGPLLWSVARNVQTLGFPAALTGPVRRGDVAALEKGRTTLGARTPAAVSLYVAGIRAQLPLARAIGDAAPEAFDAIARWLEDLPRQEK